MEIGMAGQAARRNEWYKNVRTRIGEWVNPDGTGRLPQFNAPYREPVWILPALYSGDQKDIDLANRMVARYHEGDAIETTDIGKRSGKMYNVFQTNCFCEYYFLYRDLLTPGAEEVMRWHTEQALRTFAGSAQPDFVFRGGNDNMPAHSACGLVMAGQALNNPGAIEHARWNLRQMRQLLGRNAWIGEFNSPTYTALTLTCFATVAEHAIDEEIRDLALQIEHRLWAELLLHYHPGTLHQAGPMSRAYSNANAGHNGDVQLLMWLAFGPDVTKRDIIASSFSPDGTEYVAFGGCSAQGIAAFTHFVAAELHVPEELADLSARRIYPAVLRGRAEVNNSFENGASIQTETYMEEEFSLGTASRPFCSGDHTASLFITYLRKKNPETWRDAATAFVRYPTDKVPMGILERSEDGQFRGEKTLFSQGWFYTAQKENSALLLSVPNLRLAPIESSSLQLSLVFSAHYGQITASVIGDQPVREGAVGESVEVAPVSIEAGEVFIHVQPLIPTSMRRKVAVRFSKQNNYEVLEMINYEDEPRVFDRLELSRVLNGMVVTVEANAKHASLLDFHQKMSDSRITDYLFVGMRYFEFLRDDVWFRFAVSTDSVGAMTELIDGLPRPTPIMESNQIDVGKLPFLGERSTPNVPFFPWEKMEIMEWANSWIIGSRGLPGERPYANRTESLRPVPDGPRRTMFPDKVAKEEKRRQLEALLVEETAK